MAPLEFRIKAPAPTIEEGFVVSDAHNDHEHAMPDSHDGDADNYDGHAENLQSQSELPSLETQAKLLKGSRPDDAAKLRADECLTTPLFSAAVYDSTPESTFRQYGLLAGEVHDNDNNNTTSSKHTTSGSPSRPPNEEEDHRIFLNVAAPWSAFICGSQGSGKSHTLSCMLENCLLPRAEVGHLPNPLTGIVFHYDRFSSYGSNQLCEAAYLCSSNVPVRVLVSPTNFLAMKSAYENMPGLAAGSNKPEVLPLKFEETHLNTERMMKLMAVNETDGALPLYIEVVHRILRDMATSAQGTRGFDYERFRFELDESDLHQGQRVFLNMRLELLESFLQRRTAPQHRSKHRSKPTVPEPNAWSFAPGALTIVDLSCPFVDASSACALFGMCLGIFLEQRHAESGSNPTGRIIALDEAHKFLTQSAAAAEFTEELLGVIRQQRHLGARVVVATQEPTLSPQLLDLCSLAVVHRFTSPAWFDALRAHLAGAEARPDERAALLRRIVALPTGHALLFCPSAMLRLVPVGGGGGGAGCGEGVSGSDGCASGGAVLAPAKLASEPVHVRVRARLTADGGRSIMA